MIRNGLMPALALCVGAAAALQPGKVLSQRVSGGQSHSYTIRMKAGEYLYVEAIEHEVHLHLRLLGPGGKMVAELQSVPDTPLESVQLHDIVGSAGKYRIEVRADDAAWVSGSYELKIAAQRPPTEVDRKRVQAEKLYQAAVNSDWDKKVEAVAHAGDALTMLLEMKELKRFAEMSVFTADILVSRTQYALAETRLELAVKAFLISKDQRNADMALTRLGATEAKLSHFDKAFAGFEQALKGRREAHDRLGEAEVLEGRGAAWREKDRYDKAIDDYEKALRTYRDVGGHPLDVARTLDSLSQVYLDLNQFQKALDLLGQAQELLRRFPDPYRESYLLLHLGQGHAGLTQELPLASAAREREYINAAEILKQARDLRPRKEDFTVYYSATAYRGLLQVKNGYYPYAIQSLEPAIDMAHRANDPRMEGIATNLLAAVYRSQPQYDLAISKYEEARTIFHAIDSPHLEALALAGLMRCWQGQEQPRTAIYYGKQAVNLLQEVRSDNRTLAQDMQDSFVKANEEPYHDLVDLLISQRRLAEAEQVINLLKEKEYRDYLRGANVTPSLDRVGLTPAENIWKERDELKRKRPRTAADAQRLEELDRLAAEETRAYIAYLDSLKADQSPDRADPGRLREVAEASGLKKVLLRLENQRERAAVIYTMVMQKKLVTFLITASARQKAYEYPISAAELGALVLNFRQVVQNRAVDPKPLAQKLYRIVMGRLAADLKEDGARTIMWSLDGCLRYLPLAALHDGQQYLAEQYRMSVFTPASDSRLDEKPTPKWQALGLGVTKGRAGASALPEVASELQGIISQGSGGGVLPGEIVLDEQFTEKSMREDLRKGYPVVHIASHFQFEPGDESNSFLLLGDGTRFTIADLKVQPDLFEGVQLLTLSACNTGVTEPGADGKEVESFGVLAQKQGADAVVASLWPVADSSTSLMMQRFYRVHESNPETSKLAALQQAQLALLHGEIGAGSSAADRAFVQDPPRLPRGLNAADAPTFQADPKAPYAHPYYWAAFYLMGNWL